MEAGAAESATLASGETWRSNRFAVVRASCRRLVREDPAAFVGDKRGRAEELLSSLLSGGRLGEGRFSKNSGFLYERWWYDPPGPSISSVPFLANRLGLPARGAFVPVDAFLDRRLRDAWNKPELDEPPVEATPVGYFQASERQWRSAARRMVRSGLATLIEPGSCDPRLSAGAFAVRKSRRRTG